MKLIIRFPANATPNLTRLPEKMAEKIEEEKTEDKSDKTITFSTCITK